MSDNGAAFKNENESVIEAEKYGKHVFYPACVHQYLSPNDNNLHGVAKAKWRAEFKQFEDDVRCSLYLLQCLDDVERDTITGWWSINFLEGTGRVTDEDVKSVILNGSPAMTDLHDTCYNEYLEHMGIEEELSSPEKKVKAELDGLYWAQ